MAVRLADEGTAPVSVEALSLPTLSLRVVSEFCSESRSDGVILAETGLGDRGGGPFSPPCSSGVRVSMIAARTDSYG